MHQTNNRLNQVGAPAGMTPAKRRRNKPRNRLNNRLHNHNRRNLRNQRLIWRVSRQPVVGVRRNRHLMNGV